MHLLMQFFFNGERMAKVLGKKRHNYNMKKYL